MISTKKNTPFWAVRKWMRIHVFISVIWSHVKEPKIIKRRISALIWRYHISLTTERDRRIHVFIIISSFFHYTHFIYRYLTPFSAHHLATTTIQAIRISVVGNITFGFCVIWSQVFGIFIFGGTGYLGMRQYRHWHALHRSFVV